MTDYTGQERRSTFNVRSEILSGIAKTEDQTVKSLLLLMLGVLEEIGGKIDSVISDERSLRETVLNGHSDVHPKHHEWIAEKMQAEEKNSGSFRKISEGLVQNALWIAISSAVTYLLVR
jgi:hypothetical protein